MTTAFIEQNFPGMKDTRLDNRARLVVAVWPAVRFITDLQFERELIEASKELQPNSTANRWEANARLIMNQLWRSEVPSGFDIAAQYAAAADDKELRKIPEIGPERIKAMDLALNSLRRK